MKKAALEPPFFCLLALGLSLVKALLLFFFAIEPSLGALTRLWTIARKLDHFETVGVHEGDVKAPKA